MEVDENKQPQQQEITTNSHNQNNNNTVATNNHIKHHNRNSNKQLQQKSNQNHIISNNKPLSCLYVCVFQMLCKVHVFYSRMNLSTVTLPACWVQLTVLILRSMDLSTVRNRG